MLVLISHSVQECQPDFAMVRERWDNKFRHAVMHRDRRNELFNPKICWTVSIVIEQNPGTGLGK